MEVPVSHATSEDDAFLEFLSFYPSYKDTMEIDALRHEEYPHLDEDGQVCLDYTGVGLFSSSQRSPELYGGFGIGLSPTSANLATHAMYMEGGSTESFFRKRILRYLSLDEDAYYIVFTANALSAFKLLGQSYPFHEAPNLLFAYDHECENIEAIGDCAHTKGALVQSVNLTNPLMKIDRDDLRKKLQGKKKLSNKGLFAYPYTSRFTGCKNSSQWIPEAQQNGWRVLLDVTSVDAKFSDSLGLALFLPDFLICSFYYVFGEDPTGFGCLAIKRSVLRTLGDSSRARAIGMVKIVSKHASPSSSDGSPESSSGRIIDPHMQLLKDSPGHRRTSSMHGFYFQSESPAESTSIDNTASGSTQDDAKCFKTSIPKRMDKGEATFCMKDAGTSRMHMDARGLAELVTPTESLKSKLCGVESGKDYGSPNKANPPCNSETHMQSEAGTSTSPHVSINEIELIEPIHSHGAVSISSRAKATKCQVGEPQPRRMDRGGDSVSYEKSSKELSRGEPSSHNATFSSPMEERIALDNWAVTSSLPSSILSTSESGTGEARLENARRSKMRDVSMEIGFSCRGLDHADMLGYKGVAIRLRALVNWLISSLLRLRHPHPGNITLVRIYSPLSSAERGSIIAFTLSDSAGNVLHPKKVQMLADRSGISLRTGTLAGTLSPDVRDTEDEPRDVGCVELPNYKWRARGDTVQNAHVPIVYVSLGFLNNFLDVYRLWLFVSRFLDPNFVSQEQWHYQALNQETISI